MNTLQERSDALTGSACPKKAFEALNQSMRAWSAKSVRTSNQAGGQQRGHADRYGTAMANAAMNTVLEDRPLHAGRSIQRIHGWSMGTLPMEASKS